MRKSSKPYFIITFFLVAILSLSLSTSNFLKEMMISSLAPIYELLIFKEFDENINELLPKKNVPQGKEPSVEALAAKVIFRPINSWNSSFWINVGFDNNQDYEDIIVAKNSPVLVGDAVIGVVDYAGKNQSRVRLITDSGLTPSVRVVRGGKQNQALVELIKDLSAQLSLRPDLQEKELEIQLKNLKEKLQVDKANLYLAKGELQGQSAPCFRHNSQILKGSGFNYNFEDEEGLARDLRSGVPVNGKKQQATPIVKINDLLVTTGMDGVFPAGLKVAHVTKIETLQEGDFAYDLEAKPIASNLNEITWVHVIAPIGYEDEDQPFFK